MLVVTVEFVVKSQFVEAFRAEMVKNALASVKDEPGCRQFDVCASQEDPARIFLYELYDDEAAFAAHLRTPHFTAFDAKTAPWVESKAARKLKRVCP